MNSADRPLPPPAVRRLTTDPGPWLSCDDCFALADRYVERLLAEPDAPADPEADAMRAHLAGCPACAEETTTLLLMAAADTGVDPAGALGRLGG